MTACTLPATPGDRRYVYGQTCNWHGPVALAAQRSKTNQPCCPDCGGLLYEFADAEIYWAEVRESALKIPGYVEMMQWSEGKCITDWETLENAWRQHMTEVL